jgi:hypothetical protein
MKWKMILHTYLCEWYFIPFVCVFVRNDLGDFLVRMAVILYIYILISILTITQLYVTHITDGYSIAGDTDPEGVSA